MIPARLLGGRQLWSEHPGRTWHHVRHADHQTAMQARRLAELSPVQEPRAVCALRQQRKVAPSAPPLLAGLALPPSSGGPPAASSAAAHDCADVGTGEMISFAVPQMPHGGTPSRRTGHLRSRLIVTKGRDRLNLPQLRASPQCTILSAMWIFATSRSIRSALDVEQTPRARDTLQLVLAAIPKLDARANHKILDGARDEYFSRHRQ